MIVVTGAAGRLGRRVVQLLADQNREVLATDQVQADDLPQSSCAAIWGTPRRSTTSSEARRP